MPAPASSFPTVCVGISAAITRISKSSREQPLDSGPRRSNPPAGRRHYPRVASQLVRRLFVRGNFNTVLLLPIADGRLDGVFGENGTVNLDRRKRKLADDVRVLDRQRLFDGLSLHPFRGQPRTGYG